METQAARVLPWKAPKGMEATPAESLPVMRPLDDVVIVVSDEQLDALGALFRMNPARHAMTFEAYLAVKGYAREVA